ncbi:MAG: hypothetical protein COT81_01245 [Candidatus Buchananbacteria bacterium CG10_big_fil_rev_8_21_14_0_10_42_9]|uniref:Uncharacterized protein n=1 Tax=Candidatus Buchananbacteria bacterium CG10_big_fil_rev_8_21_14_0_10_42_9 TaxID=1974526 RepID=A0A2H0W1Z6_9BACT|nr:MAG: hypothetical protein COT81_01245 [Candidatus Buchananbacteria bacterium CG10_big_fil_rev_8_21_14_0_10_42_9]
MPTRRLIFVPAECHVSANGDGAFHASITMAEKFDLSRLRSGSAISECIQCAVGDAVSEAMGLPCSTALKLDDAGNLWQHVSVDGGYSSSRRLADKGEALADRIWPMLESAEPVLVQAMASEMARVFTDYNRVYVDYAV